MKISDYSVVKDIRANVFCTDEVADKIVDALDTLCGEGFFEVYAENSDGSTVIRGSLYGNAEHVEVTDHYWETEYDFVVDTDDVEWVLNKMGVRYNLAEGAVEENTFWKDYIY